MTSAKTAKTLAVAIVGAVSGLGAAVPAHAATRPTGFVPRLTSGLRAGPRLVPETTEVACAGAYEMTACAQIIGHSRHVSAMWMYACNDSDYPVALHMEVLSPKGNYENTSTYVLSPSSCLPVWYPPKFQDFTANVGEWDFRAWREISDHWYDVQVQRGVAA